MCTQLFERCANVVCQMFFFECQLFTRDALWMAGVSMRPRDLLQPTKQGPHFNTVCTRTNGQMEQLEHPLNSMSRSVVFGCQQSSKASVAAGITCPHIIYIHIYTKRGYQRVALGRNVLYTTQHRRGKKNSWLVVVVDSAASSKHISEYRDFWYHGICCCCCWMATRKSDNRQIVDWIRRGTKKLKK